MENINIKSSKQNCSTESGATDGYLSTYCEGHWWDEVRKQKWKMPQYLENMRNYLNNPHLSTKKAIIQWKENYFQLEIIQWFLSSWYIFHTPF